MARLTALATAVPDHVVAQADVVAAARRVFGGRSDAFNRMIEVYANAGVETRHLCVPLAWYEAESGWAGRNALYLEHATALLESAAQACLDEAGLAPEAVDALVTVGSTGIATPSLDALLMARMPFRPDVLRLPIFGLGCAGGVLGLGRAAALAEAMPEMRVLLLVVELCGLTFRRADAGKSNIVATALFGDGAAAALVEGGDLPDSAGATIAAWGEHTWPDRLDVMGWEVADDGLGVLFSPDIPALVRRDLRPVADAFLAGHGLVRDDLDGLICHPGGAKVLAALAEAFALSEDDLATEREVLRRYGNMSSATVLFVLDQRRRHGLRGRHLLTALGPGFTAGFALLDCP